MSPIENSKVAEVFAQYPEHIRQKLLSLRQLVLDTASETEGADKVEETLRWGEPSYITKSGSPLRLGWKASKPDQYAMYFICTTKLVDTFKELYRDQFKYESTRAILFHENDDIPVEELKHCISLTLTYRSRKHLPMLGV